ncbi:hypothetical protein [Mesorhizobium sp.]|uniref:hypothetical protein n=1 Tax=Mesorhizobium sp. TaxID=1871066 RepID=UPI000FE33794|nr:hypothetical protein [Mesorhizobium sp.]RWQ14581.1 MAG: hypothetical protein EOR92_26225 [Mesorhizobium sp.]
MKSIESAQAGWRKTIDRRHHGPQQNFCDLDRVPGRKLRQRLRRRPLLTKVKDPGMGWIFGRIVRKNSDMQRLLRIEWNAAP